MVESENSQLDYRNARGAEGEAKGHRIFEEELLLLLLLLLVATIGLKGGLPQSGRATPSGVYQGLAGSGGSEAKRLLDVFGPVHGNSCGAWEIKSRHEWMMQGRPRV